MGYTPQRKVITLSFDESDDLHGLEIKINSLSYKEAETILTNGAVMDADFISRVQSWNLEDPDTGKALPIAADSLGYLDAIDIRRIKTSWFNTCLGRVPDFLERKSSDGDSPEVASLPMESL